MRVLYTAPRDPTSLPRTWATLGWPDEHELDFSRHSDGVSSRAPPRGSRLHVRRADITPHPRGLGFDHGASNAAIYGTLLWGRFVDPIAPSNFEFRPTAVPQYDVLRIGAGLVPPGRTFFVPNREDFISDTLLTLSVVVLGS